MNNYDFVLYLLVMAGVTYLIRMIPMVLCRGRLENKFMQSFLGYVPYAVLGSMTFPAIFYSTGHLLSGLAGSVVALFLAFKRKGLLLVAVGACVAALAVEIILQLVC